ncbi:E3 ubiquitin-protein ligase RNF123 isoform X3 [Kogia breviceps]|uniref:E3 ubiquitin-protein ligase RNF123 isoform X3 n=1 Tax=Kogia breviceps TaxID=27615 RepID=UPI0034D2E610
MASKGAGMAFSRKSYGLTSDAEKSRVTGIVHEKLLDDYLHRIFSSTGRAPMAATSRKLLNFQNLPEHLDQLLHVDEEAEEEEESQGQVEGRLGPSTVVLDHTGGFEGLLLVDDDLLGVIGHSNFGTIRSTTCVYKGKWVYEVLISSQGLMQIGWCTINCRFNQEEGVGDTHNSYAYDGNRVRKWNVTTTNYGKAWAAGDIVSCLIDLDEGTLSFCLNGVSLGTAFENLSRGLGMAYFPAISLSFKESVAFNFGSRPLRYPVVGYRPLQDPPSADLVRAQELLGCFQAVLSVELDPVQGRLVEKESSEWQLQGQPTVLLTLAHIFHRFAPLLRKVYLVEAVLMSFLLGVVEAGTPAQAQSVVHQVLDLLWLFMEDYEVQDCLKQLMMSLLRLYRFSPIVPDLALQIRYLRLTIAILSHEKSRKFLLSHVLYPLLATRQARHGVPSGPLGGRNKYRGCQALSLAVPPSSVPVTSLHRALAWKWACFDVLRSVVFFYIKSPLRVEEAGLQELIPTTWWPHRSSREGKESKEVKDETSEERLRRRAYERGCQRLKKRIEVVEELQVQILKLLLNNQDDNGGEASRYIFLTKFRKFLQENASSRGNMPMLCPPEYMVCFLHRLISALRYYWDEYKASNPRATFSEEAYIPPQVFYNGKVDYFDLQRLGGLLSHLRKTLKDDLASKANILIDPLELQAATMDDLDEDEEPAPAAAQRPMQALAMGGALPLPRPSWLSSPTLGRANRFLSTAAVSLMTPRRPLSTSEKVKVRTLSAEQRTREDIEGSQWNEGLLVGRPPEEPEQPLTENSLLEVLDGAIMMYNLSVHQQLGKMVGVSDDVNEYAMALRDTEDKLRRCPKRRKDILAELTKSQKVFSEKLDHLSRRLAWVHATVYSQEKMQDIYWLLRVCLRTIEHGDRTGPLFAFMPEFYLSVAINSYSALKNYFGPVHSMEELPGYEETLTRLAAILAKHFADTRIVGTDIRDSLMQALASYVCYPNSLRAVERIPEEQRIAMVRSLLAPYEQRPWAQTNWILVRLWRGCGFGYRYTRLPHLLKTKPEDANLPSLQKPCPSTLLQQHMADLLREGPDVAPSFLNSVLNQLNWAFSEFIGMIQEIQQAAERLERNFVDSRQLKVCATCFDLSVSLLRVLEMTITLVPEIFLDWAQPTSEMLLRRLAQLLNQVLNRVTAERNLFDRVVTLRLPGLESVDHYPILVAVTGILVRLLVHGPASGTERATSVLLADPCFQLRSICYLLGQPEPPTPGTALPAPDQKRFSLQSYTDYISVEELAQVEQMLAHLTSASAQAAAASLPTSEEDLCPICYAHPISAVFQPCGHKSCKACINQHLMNNKDCFFCKATIVSVEDWDKAASASATSSAA